MSVNTDIRKKVVIAGGGITGLSAAHYVKKLLDERNVDAELVVVENSERLGGKVRTLHRDGFVIEQGPDSFLARKLPIIELTRELGLEGELVGTNPAANKTYILHNGGLHGMPKGLLLGIPTDLDAFLQTELVSPECKERVKQELELPGSGNEADESIGGFVERRLGRELLTHVAEPILAGIYAGDTYKLSLHATFPQFQQAELKFGSVIRGMAASRTSAPPPSPMSLAIPEAYRSSMFLSYRQGLETLLDGLRKALDGVTHIRDSVIGVEHTNGRCAVMTEQQGIIEADAVIVTVPGYTASQLLGSIPEAKWLGDMEYVSVANVVFAYDRGELTHPLDGSGFVIPRKEGRFITACTWTSSKWLHTAPEGKALLRCYVGRSGEQDWMKLSDDEIISRVKNELAELMGIEAEPLFVELTRLNRSMPQYPVGHLESIQRLRERLHNDFPGLYVTGAAFEGVGLPDCIRQAKEAAESAASHLDRTV